MTMHHLLLTLGSPELRQAAQQVWPGVRVHSTLSDLFEDISSSTPAKIYCFVDWLSEEMSGLEMCRRLRADARTRNAHITMVIDSGDMSERSRALAAGADDYVALPLTPQLLAARLSVYTAMAFVSDDDGSRPFLQCGFGLTVDPLAQQVKLNGRLIPVRPRELRVLEIFLNNSDRLLSRQKIIEMMGKEHEVEDARTVDVWVGRLRRTLDAYGLCNVIRTVRPLGYVFDTPGPR